MDWITLVVILCLILLTAAKLINSNRFNELLLLPISNKYFLVHGKNRTIFSTFNVLLLLVQILSVSIFLYFLITVFFNEFKTQGVLLYLQIVSYYTLFLGVKFYIEKIIANLFSFDEYLEIYLYHKLSYRNLMGIFLLGINILFLYTLPQSPLLLLILILILLLVNLLSLFYTYRTNEKFIIARFFYFILYLCALEISPYLILYKAIV
ncbi:MAG: DUF4271 domain-containing protein [Flavobacteriaceae bacterium CG_4_8_14_3_um_filter_34_10]|nr:MAG: hypothetical protein AUK33_05045 [Flavobacteriaceae bacterium CG2_30_34_30]PIV48717.1 MAG: DUF4271 domain-containing protein [Flavobacteriaceae bacterium CG02_land_8_20_14_3_00_34_13]PIX09962.1 MAG: DUF4271 domain-containing protein [Flavobacteriaceae bacterium CG_4_8_14_3_um_filter_34_10]PIZ08683.1 MAG: DUF4271 domain-containing protein [Flavobacteriaceae bacterium CG_4_10_14_0_8_um_filter_34_31]PJC07373.1 MAG: DUF4271 domain-containing protein [Flavobacteriaceae bacterium CG_4_9_14_0_